MSPIVRSLSSALLRDRQLVRLVTRLRNRRRTVEEVFTGIYRRNLWGGHGEFDSGRGTTDERVVSAYIEMVSRQSKSEGFRDRSFVDLGCGDFRVGSRLLPFCSSYVGVDIVRPLIAKLNETRGNGTTRFLHSNLIEDELPAGDVCFVRQVLQHLSNQQIATVLRKLVRYPWVFITEHYPSDNPRIRPNLDKVHGGDVRVYDNSGVYLTEPPFSLRSETLQQVLEVPGVGLGDCEDPGVIRTFLYKPGYGRADDA